MVSEIVNAVSGILNSGLEARGIAQFSSPSINQEGLCREDDYPCARFVKYYGSSMTGG